MANSKKKAGILTFHNAHNYGAVLQAYALKTKLNEMGHEAQVVNYCNPKVQATYPRHLLPVYCKRDLLPTHWKQNLVKIIDCIYGWKSWGEQWEKFEAFIQTHLLNGKTEKLGLEQLAELDLDLFILGSDQIWESYITGGLDRVYLGDFSTDADIVSYAASLNGSSLSEQEAAVLKEKLPRLKEIAVREEKLAAYFRELLNREVYTVVDPTLLLEAKDYEPLINKDLEEKEKYIFAYFVREDEALTKCVKEIQKQKNIKVIELHYFRTMGVHEENQIANIGPSEFLYYIKNAEFVLTNSFHGTVFSVLYEKQFYCVYEKNTRIENLLEFIDATNRHIRNEQMIDMSQVVDYSDVSGKLEAYRKQSVDYLELALKG